MVLGELVDVVEMSTCGEAVPGKRRTQRQTKQRLHTQRVQGLEHQPANKKTGSYKDQRRQSSRTSDDFSH